VPPREAFCGREGAGVITVERHLGKHRCEACHVEFSVLSGAVLEKGHPLGSYILGLHGHSGEARLAQLALALLDRRDPSASPVAVALQVSATEREFQMTVVDWAESPWAGETYLGKMLERVEVVENPLRSLLLDMADRVLRELPEVESYFA
jgi:hypothetical protein